MATLSVQEAMGFKVDREAVATLVLPQLWAMSMGPCKFTYLPNKTILIHPSSIECRAISALHACHKKTW